MIALALESQSGPYYRHGPLWHSVARITNKQLKAKVDYVSKICKNDQNYKKP
jgi:hypothetical protein